MSARGMLAMIGKRGTLRVSGTVLTFTVEIRDARQRYGQIDYLVRPVAGEGETWHASSSIMVEGVER